MSVAASPTLARVLRGQLCTGCGLCAGVSDGAIALGTTPPGYTRPIQRAPISDSAERAIATACPGAVVAPWPATPTPHPSWGPAREVATGHAIDAEVRFLGSSGGVLSALALAALDTGLADAVLHVGADPDRPTRNVIRWSESRAEVLAGAGSRYAASSPLADIDARLASGKRLVFIGKPCDVSALRQLATIDPRVDALVPLMLSFFCGGIPSHDGSDRIIRAMGLEPAEVVAFRYRGNGWPGRARAETADGRIGDMSYHDSWGGHLSKEVQFRCKICPDAVGGVADVAAGDAWYGGEAGYPLFDEADGRSLIIARTAAGAAFLDRVRAAGGLETAPLDIAEIDRMQYSQARRKRLIAARTAACLATAQPRPRMRGLQVAAAARQAPPREALKNFFGDVAPHRYQSSLMPGKLIAPLKPHRYLALDSLRGICALIVALFHFHTTGFITNLALVRNGWLFVDFFFVLSGFVITDAYYGKMIAGFSARRFLWLRLGRLYPLHVFVLALMVVLELIAAARPGGVDRVAFSEGRSLAHLAASLTLTNAFGIFNEPSWNVPAWSIGAEFWCYVVFAALVSTFRTRALPVMAAIAGLAGLWFAFGPIHSINTTHLMGFLRCLYGFGTGMLLHSIVAGNISGLSRPFLWEALVVIFIVVFVSFAQGQSTVLAPVVFAAAIFVFAKSDGPVSAALCSRPLVMIGTLSYSIYLLHAFVIARLIEVLRFVGHHSPLVTVDNRRDLVIGPWADLVTIAALLVLIAVSTITYAVIEKPGQRWVRRHPKSE